MPLQMVYHIMFQSLKKQLYHTCLLWMAQVESMLDTLVKSTNNVFVLSLVLQNNINNLTMFSMHLPQKMVAY